MFISHNALSQTELKSSYTTTSPVSASNLLTRIYDEQLLMYLETLVEALGRLQSIIPSLIKYQGQGHKQE